MKSAIAPITKPNTIPVGKSELWNLYRDGITFSLLCKFLNCRYRFKLLVIDGLKDEEGFRKELEFGNWFHAGMEAVADYKGGQQLTSQVVQRAMRKHTQGLLKQFSSESATIQFWEQLAFKMFAIYLNTWSKSEKDYILQEQTFKIPYTLPSGRTIPLRGKWDAVFVQETKRRPSLWIQENKTKGEVLDNAIAKCLPNDLQTMFYTIAMQTFLTSPVLDRLPGISVEAANAMTECRLTGVLYNVIRRPLADNYAIKKRKDESDRDFIERVLRSYEGKSKLYPIAKHAKDWFYRWSVTLTKTDIERFRVQTLDPILEMVCDWFDWMTVSDKNPFTPIGETPKGNKISNRFHFRMPFGVYSPMARGLGGDYFDFLTTSSKRKLVNVSTVFPELEP